MAGEGAAVDDEDEEMYIETESERDGILLAAGCWLCETTPDAVGVSRWQ